MLLVDRIVECVQATRFNGLVIDQRKNEGPITATVRREISKNESDTTHPVTTTSRQGCSVLPYFRMLMVKSMREKFKIILWQRGYSRPLGLVLLRLKVP